MGNRLSTSEHSPLTIETPRFGVLTIDAKRIITVVGALLECLVYTRYVILNDDEDMAIPLQWMQSVENPVRAFVIVDPWVFMANYAVTPPDEVCASLDLSAAQPPSRCQHSDAEPSRNRDRLSCSPTTRRATGSPHP